MTNSSRRRCRRRRFKNKKSGRREEGDHHSGQRIRWTLVKHKANWLGDCLVTEMLQKLTIEFVSEVTNSFGQIQRRIASSSTVYIFTVFFVKKLDDKLEKNVRVFRAIALMSCKWTWKPNQNFGGGRAVQRRRGIDIEKWEAKGKFSLRCWTCWDTVCQKMGTVFTEREDADEKDGKLVGDPHVYKTKSVSLRTMCERVANHEFSSGLNGSVDWP